MNDKEVDKILERLHKKSLMSGVFNDQEVHVMPSHGTADGCIDEAKSAISKLLLKAKREELNIFVTDLVSRDSVLNEKSILNTILEYQSDRLKELQNE